MNILFITSHQNTLDIETKRIREEAEKMDHSFTIYNSTDFDFDIINNTLNIPGITNKKPDVVLVRGIHNSLKQMTMVVDYYHKENIKIFDDHFHLHKYSINKITDLLKLSQERLPLPNTVYSKNYEHYHTMANRIGYPVIIKPIGSGKGHGIFKIENENELTQFIEQRQLLELPPKSMIMQEFIPYEYDLRILIIGDNIHCMRRIPPAGDFRANFSIGGSVELYSASKEILDLATKALHTVGLTIGGVDILITKDKKNYVLEVNHNPGFEGMEKATGENIAKVYLDYAISQAQ